MIKVVSALLEGFAAAAPPLFHPGAERKTKFHASSTPPISIFDYLQRIDHYANCCQSSYVLSLIYLDRLLKKHHDIRFGPKNMHRLILTSLLLAIKKSRRGCVGLPSRVQKRHFIDAILTVTWSLIMWCPTHWASTSFGSSPRVTSRFFEPPFRLTV